MSKTTKTVIWLIVAVIIITGIWWGVGRKSTQLPTAKKEVIKIGAILPLTGVESRVGELSKNGLIMAEQEINARGGIQGKDIKVIIEDFQSETKKAVTSYNYLKSVHKIPVILTIGSPVAMSLSPLVNKDRIILFAIAAAPPYSTPDDFTYRMVPSAAKEGKDMANLTYNKLNIKRLAIIYLNNDFGVGVKNTFSSEYTKLGGIVLLEEAFNPDDSDFRTQLTKIKESNPEAIYIASWGKQAGLIAKQAREMNINVQLLCGQACQNPDLIKEGGSAVEGLIYPYTYANKNARFYNEYYRKYREEATQISERMYDFLKITAEIINRCGVKDKNCLLNELQTKEFNGTSGTIKFDLNGDPVENMVLYTVKNGKFVSYKD